MLKRLLLLLSLAGLVACAEAERDTPGCTRDTDCRNPRICVHGSCQNPDLGPYDGGDAKDAGHPKGDAGPDAGHSPDAGHAPDAGSTPDAGSMLDAGSEPDAGPMRRGECERYCTDNTNLENECGWNNANAGYCTADHACHDLLCSENGMMCRDPLATCRLNPVTSAYDCFYNCSNCFHSDEQCVTWMETPSAGVKSCLSDGYYCQDDTSCAGNATNTKCERDLSKPWGYCVASCQTTADCADAQNLSRTTDDHNPANYQCLQGRCHYLGCTADTDCKLGTANVRMTCHFK